MTPLPSLTSVPTQSPLRQRPPKGRKPDESLNTPRRLTIFTINYELPVAPQRNRPHPRPRRGAPISRGTTHYPEISGARHSLTRAASLLSEPVLSRRYKLSVCVKKCILRWRPSRRDNNARGESETGEGPARDENLYSGLREYIYSKPNDRETSTRSSSSAMYHLAPSFRPIVTRHRLKLLD